LVKYNSNGIAQWARSPTTSSGTNFGSFFQSVAVDATGNVYVCGYQYQPQTIIFNYGNGASAQGINLNQLSTGDQSYAVIVKYDSNGIAQWARTVSQQYDSFFYTVAVDAIGNVYAAGEHLYETTFGIGVTALSDFGNRNAVLVKYNTNGISQWVRTVNSSNYSRFRHLIADASNNVYAINSQIGDGDRIYSYGNGVTVQGIGQQGVLVKYNTNGLAQWARIVSSDTGSLGSFTGLAVDTSGNVYASGFQQGTDIFTYGSNVIAQGTSLNNNAVLVKYNTNGLAQWAQTVSSGTGSSSSFSGLAVDAFGNIYVTGSQHGTGIFTYGTNVTAQGTSLNNNSVLIKYKN